MESLNLTHLQPQPIPQILQTLTQPISLNPWTLDLRKPSTEIPNPRRLWLLTPPSVKDRRFSVGPFSGDFPAWLHSCTTLFGTKPPLSGFLRCNFRRAFRRWSPRFSVTISVAYLRDLCKWPLKAAIFPDSCDRISSPSGRPTSIQSASSDLFSGNSSRSIDSQAICFLERSVLSDFFQDFWYFWVAIYRYLFLL